MWPSTGRARSGEQKTPSGLSRNQPEECWEEEERLNCALRAFFGRAVRWMEIHQVNLEYEQSAMTGIISSEFFTESLILAQNERWRRV